MRHQDDTHIEQMPMQLQTAQKTRTATLASHCKSNFAMAVAILQGLTALNAFAAEVGASRSRPEIATGEAGALLGAVGILGDPADSVAATAVAGIAAAGLKVNPGA